MKRALAGVLPDDILERRKRGFGTPMGAWLKNELAPVLRNVLSTRAVGDRGLFDPVAVDRLINSHETSRADATDQLLTLLNLEIWCRMFLDGRTPDDVSDELRMLAA
jgi:asparagine synthase (glutamine-hydrolysing)